MTAIKQGKLAIIAASAAAALALSACNGVDEPDVTEDDGVTETPPDTTPPPDDPAQERAVIGTQDTEFGEILVDGAGRTLYLFNADSDGVSTCYGQCAEVWPPLLTADEGIDLGIDDAAETEGNAEGDLVDTTERDDGTVQVTYNGWPLYYFQDDTAAGDINGQGVEDVWYVVDPEGNPVTEQP